MNQQDDLLQFMVVAALVISLVLYFFGCGHLPINPLPSRPDMGRAPIYSIQPRRMHVDISARNPNAPSLSMIAEAGQAVMYIADYYSRLGMKVVPPVLPADLDIHLRLFDNNHDIHLGRADITFDDAGYPSCAVSVNAGRLDLGPATRRAVRAVILHEFGHCLGLVTRAAECAEGDDVGDLCECWHPDCAMTRMTGDNWLLVLATWAGKDDVTYGLRCEEFLRSRLARVARYQGYVHGK